MGYALSEIVQGLMEAYESKPNNLRNGSFLRLIEDVERGDLSYARTVAVGESDKLSDDYVKEAITKFLFEDGTLDHPWSFIDRLRLIEDSSSKIWFLTATINAVQLNAILQVVLNHKSILADSKWSITADSASLDSFAIEIQSQNHEQLLVHKRSLFAFTSISFEGPLDEFQMASG